VRAELVIIAETEAVPRRVLMINPGIEPEVVDAIRDILIGMDETEEGQALLEILRTAQFDEFPEGTEAAFEPIQAMYEIILGQE